MKKVDNIRDFVVPDPGNHICTYQWVEGVTPSRVVLCTGSWNILLRSISMVNQPAGWSYWIHDCDDAAYEKYSLPKQCFFRRGMTFLHSATIPG